MNELGLPVPEPDEDDAAWWERLQAGELAVAACDACGARWGRPLPTCPACASDAVTLVATSGRGSVYTWVTVRRALDPAFEDQVPYTVVTVDLDDGGRVVGRLLGGNDVDERSRVAFEPWTQAGWQLVGFRPVQEGPA